MAAKVNIMNTENLSGNVKCGATLFAPAKSLARFIMVIAMVAFGAVAAHAAAPKMVFSTTTPSVLENGTTTVNITLSDASTNATVAGITLSATSSETNLVTDSDLVTGGSGSARTLQITPEADQFGTATITVVATDAQPVSVTNTITLHISLVNQGPTNTLSTNFVSVAEESAAQTVTGFVTDMAAGPASQSAETWVFNAITASGDASNAVFSVLPHVATNGTLTFTPKAHSYGTNIVTLVMVNNGGTANHGTNSFTNSFMIGVAQTFHAPTFLKVAPVSIWEDTTNTVTVNVTNWDFDINSTNFDATSFSLAATSGNTNLATIDIVTNSAAVKGTNVVFTLTLNLVTNAWGSETNTLIATEAGLSTTNTFKLTINHVNQQPSFDLSTNFVGSVEETLAVTNTSFLTNLLAGPTNANETNQTWHFTLTTAKGSATNALFSKAPAIATNGTLTYYPKAHSYGTNLVTIVMTDNGGTQHGGVDTYTNTFLIGIAATNHPPGFLKIANQTILENATNTPVTVTVWDFDQNSTNFNTTNFVLTATSSDTNLETITVSTNVTASKVTNAVFSVIMAPGTNQFGVVTNTLVCTEGGFSTTNTFKLTITHVNQAPSFSFNTNVVISNLFSSWEENLSVSNANFLTNMQAGPNTNENNQTWRFTVTTASGATTNALFTRLPAIATNGTLTYAPKLHSYGTNLVTIVMTDNGGVANHGHDTYTNSFLLAIERTNHAPQFLPVTNITVLENVSNTTTHVLLWSFDQNTTNFAATNFSLAATSGNTTLATVTISTNISSYNATNAVFTLVFTPQTNQFGVVTNTLVATQDGNSTTNTILLTITHVNQTPSFTFNTNLLVSNLITSVEETLSVTNVAFLTNISVGPTNETGQTWSNKVIVATNGTTNAQFTILPMIATNGTLTYSPKAHSFGTNLVTVIMTDNGGTLNGGVNSYTNTFLLGIIQTNHAPTIVTTNLTNVTLLENLTNLTVPVSVWDYDLKSSNFTLTATSGNTALETIAVSTNVSIVNSSNAVFSVVVTPVTNQFGTITNTLVATEGALSTTNTMLVTIAHVNQAPSYTFDTNVLTSNVLSIAENAGPTNIAGFLTNLLAGPTNESTQTWTNTAITIQTNATNASFTQLLISTNGTLSLTAATNSFGTNYVTVVMTDNGGTANGGVNSYTNHFTIAVAQVWYPPSFIGVTNKTILENQSTNLTLTFTLYNHLDTNFVVTPVASDTNLATVTAHMVGSNCTLTFVPVTNQNGTNTITVTAVADSLTNTTNLDLVITPVTQPPSFTLLTHTYTVDQYNVAVTLPDITTNVSVGPANQVGETVGFVVTNSSSNLFTVQPSVSTDGTNGTLTFTPGATGGTVTVGIELTNSGSTANGGVNHSAFQTMTITIPANTFAGVTGTYAGLFYNTNAIENPSSGFVMFNLTSNGVFAGYFVNTSTSNSINGQFDISNYSASVTATPYIFELTIDTSTNQAIAGTVSNTTGEWSSTLQGYRQGFSTGSTSLAGKYTMALQGFDDPTNGPPGDSIFSATITSSGFVTFGGTMADDTAVDVPSNVQISVEGFYPLYAQLYSGGALGTLIGWLDFTSGGLSTNSGLTWFALAGASANYTAGFTNQGVPIGSPYNSATHLSLTSPTVVLSGGNLQTNLTNAVTVANGVITVTPATNGLSLTIDQATGGITGQFVDPNSGTTNAISGAVLQNTNINPGFFNGTSQGGAFILMGN